MQTNEYEQFQNRMRLQESQRFLGFKSHSQIRSFLDGKKVAHSNVLDTFVWLIGGGYEKIRIGGEVPEQLVNRQDRPSVSLEKFFSEYLHYFFKPDYKQSLIENLYIKFTNQMDANDVHIVYAATSGKIDIDPEVLEVYAGDRRFPNGTPIFQRERYDALKAAEAAETKDEKEDLENTASTSPVAPSQSVIPTVATADQTIQTDSGYDPLSVETDEDEDDPVDPVVVANAKNSSKAPSKPKAKVDEPKKERKVRAKRTKETKE